MYVFLSIKLFNTDIFPFPQVCLALRYYASGGDYTLIGDFQGVTRSLICKFVHDFTEFMYAYQLSFINFPYTLDDHDMNARDFCDNFGQKPCVIECMDSIYIAIKGLLCDIEYMYVSRKGYHSLKVLVTKLFFMSSLSL